jgi:hypothetical protein
MTKPHLLQTGMNQQVYFTASMVTVRLMTSLQTSFQRFNEVVMWLTVNVPDEKRVNNGESWRKKAKSVSLIF